MLPCARTAPHCATVDWHMISLISARNRDFLVIVRLSKILATAFLAQNGVCRQSVLTCCVHDW